MIRHWKRHVMPIIETVRPRRIMEIGADWGWTTREALAWCRSNDARMDVVDPSPRPELHEELAKFDKSLYRYHALKSLQAIPQLLTPDVALIDGDHNWFTVYNELRLLESQARSMNRPAPVFVLHDVGWPYGRRDGYYAPKQIPRRYRRPNAQLGLERGNAGLLTEGGANRNIWNAKLEGGKRPPFFAGFRELTKDTRRLLSVCIERSISRVLPDGSSASTITCATMHSKLTRAPASSGTSCCEGTGIPS